MGLRVRTFAHIHELSIAEQSEEKRGVFVARVTADVDALQQFTEWGGIAWILSGPGRRRARADAPVLVAARGRGRASWSSRCCSSSVECRPGLSIAYDTARTRVGEMLSRGLRVRDGRGGRARVRARRAHVDRRVKRRDRRALPRRDGRALPSRDAVAAVVGLLRRSRWPRSWSLGAVFGPRWGLTFGRVTAFLFLADVFLHVFTDLPEVYSETQTAIAGWRKILAVLDLPVEIVEPAAGVELPRGALRCEADDVRFSYREAAGCSTASRCGCRPAATSRSSARPAAARRRS